MVGPSLVSVIVPVYNVAPYLREALDSVLGQTYGNLELVVVDDGSADGSGEICDEYATRDLRVVVVHQRNAGLSAARNTGLDRATGQVIVFLDSDDAYHPDFIQTMVSVMRAESADLVVCGYAYRKTDGRMSREPLSSPDSDVPRTTFDCAGALRYFVDKAEGHVAWNKLYARHVLDGIRYPEGHVYEDTDVFYRVLDARDKVCVIEQPMVYRRLRPGSITDVASEENARDLLRAYGHLCDFVVENVPEIFDTDHPRRVRQMQLAMMSGGYLRHLRTRSSADQPFWESFRRQMIDLGRAAGTDRFGAKGRLIFGLMCRYPSLFGIAYRTLLRVRRFAQHLAH